MNRLIFSLLLIVAVAVCNAQSWRMVTPEVSTSFNSSVNTITFPARDTGYAASLYDLWKTTDGGNTWTQSYHCSVGVIISVFFLDAETGWIIGGEVPSGFALRTTDGGAHWRKQEGDLKQLCSAWFFNPRIGWAVGNDGTKGLYYVYYTRDSGRHWEQKREGRDYVRYISFINKRVGWILGDNSHIYKTVNGGKKWRHIAQQGVHHLNYMQAVSEHSLWAIEHFTAGLCFYSADGGINWQQRKIATGGFSAVHFTSAGTGWMVGNNGLVVKTTDGGAHWVEVPCPTKVNLNTLSFPSPDCGYIGGDNGVVLRLE